MGSINNIADAVKATGPTDKLHKKDRPKRSAGTELARKTLIEMHRKKNTRFFCILSNRSLILIQKKVKTISQPSIANHPSINRPGSPCQTSSCVYPVVVVFFFCSHIYIQGLLNMDRKVVPSNLRVQDRGCVIRNKVY